MSEPHTDDQVAKNLQLNRYVGSPVIETVHSLLKNKDRCQMSWSASSRNPVFRLRRTPGTVPEVVQARAEAEAKQAATQDGFAFILRREEDTTVSANDIDRILVSSRDLRERHTAWEASKTIGRPLRDGLLRLRDLRNKVAQAVGFDDFFALQVADYRDDRSRDDRPLRPDDRRRQSAIPAAPRLVPTHPGASDIGAEAARRQDPCSLASQPMGPELAEPG